MRYIYFIKDSNEHYKVGVAADVKSRLGSIQTGNPLKLQVVCTRLVDKAEVLERQLHEYLAKHVATGGREWFKLTHEQAIEVCTLIYSPPKLVPIKDKIATQFISDISIDDELNEAIGVFMLEGKASTSLLQRKLSIGYGKAARIMDRLEELGWVTELEGSHARMLIKTVEVVQ